MKNQRPFDLTGQAPLRETIYKRQLNFKGHCIGMPIDEPSNRFVIYESKIRLSFRQGAASTNYHHKSLSIILPGEKMLEANEIKNMAVNKSKRSQLFSCLRRKSLRTDLFNRMMKMMMNIINFSFSETEELSFYQPIVNMDFYLNYF